MRKRFLGTCLGVVLVCSGSAPAQTPSLLAIKGAPPLTALARSQAVATSVMRTVRALPR